MRIGTEEGRLFVADEAHRARWRVALDPVVPEERMVAVDGGRSGTRSVVARVSHTRRARRARRAAEHQRVVFIVVVTRRAVVHGLAHGGKVVGQRQRHERARQWRVRLLHARRVSSIATHCGIGGGGVRIREPGVVHGHDSHIIYRREQCARRVWVGTWARTFAPEALLRREAPDGLQTHVTVARRREVLLDESVRCALDDQPFLHTWSCEFVSATNLRASNSNSNSIFIIIAITITITVVVAATYSNQRTNPIIGRMQVLPIRRCARCSHGQVRVRGHSGACRC